MVTLSVPFPEVKKLDFGQTMTKIGVRPAKIPPWKWPTRSAHSRFTEKYIPETGPNMKTEILVWSMFDIRFYLITFISHLTQNKWRKAGDRLEVPHYLVEVLVHLVQLGRELLVLEGVALLVEDLGHGGDQQQPLLGLNLGVNQVPENRE